MKQAQFAVLCVMLLTLWVTDTKTQNQAPGIKELEDRIEKLEGDLTRIKEEAKVPVGTILPFYKDPSKLPPNWKLCEGQKVADTESPFFNQSLPDLRGRFLRGAQIYEQIGSKHEFSQKKGRTVLPRGARLAAC